MKRKRIYIIVALLVLLALVCILCVAYFKSTDITAVYTRNKLSWTGAHPLEDGSIKLELKKGETSVWIKNDVKGNIGYNVYLYSEDEISNEITMPAGEMTQIDKNEYPYSLRECDVEYAYRGYLKGGEKKSVKIGTNADVKLSLLIIIEDNNSYPKEEQSVSSVANVKFSAEVLLDGQYPRGNDYSFSLKDESGEVIETVNNDDGYISFSNIGIKVKGTYIYYLFQNEGKNKETSYDKSIYKINVVVEDTNVVNVSYEKDGVPQKTLPRFSNYKEISANAYGENMAEYPTNEKKADEQPNYLLIAASVIGILIIVLCIMMRKNKE